MLVTECCFFLHTQDWMCSSDSAWYQARIYLTSKNWALNQRQNITPFSCQDGQLKHQDQKSIRFFKIIGNFNFHTRFKMGFFILSSSGLKKPDELIHPHKLVLCFDIWQPNRYIWLSLHYVNRIGCMLTTTDTDYRWQAQWRQCSTTTSRALR